MSPAGWRTVRQENGRFPGMVSDQPPRTSKPPENPFPKSYSACSMSSVFSCSSLTSSCRSTTRAFSLLTAGALLSCSRPRLAPDAMAFPMFTDTCRFGGQSQLICAGTLDLASVSAIVRRVSDSVRPRRPIFSPIVRWKPALIARRPHFDCAPLQLAGVQQIYHVAAQRGDTPAWLQGAGTSKWPICRPVAGSPGTHNKVRARRSSSRWQRPACCPTAAKLCGS